MSFEAPGTACARFNRGDCSTQILVTRCTSSLVPYSRVSLSANPHAPRHFFGGTLLYFVLWAGHESQAETETSYVSQKGYSFEGYDA